MTDDELNAEIDKLCAEKALHFKLWELPPSWVHEGMDCPWPPSTSAAATWPKAVALRLQLIAEIGARQKQKRPVARRAKPKDGKDAVTRSTR